MKSNVIVALGVVVTIATLFVLVSSFLGWLIPIDIHKMR